MQRTFAFPLVLALVISFLVASAAGTARAAGASGVLVSQIYGGGGNAGATFQNDFVELLNTSSSSVDLSGFTVQYATAAGTSWQVTTLSGSVGPGRYYLVELASGGTAGAALPAPDATGTTNLAASGGKVALVHGAAALTCGASAGSCASAVGLEDLVGYGSAADFEGAAAAPALDSTHAAARGASGCTDTGSNADDFTAATPAPRTTSSAAAACGGGTTTHPTLTATATVSADVQSALTISVDQPALAFGPVLAGTAPTRLPEHVTVVSNVATGYSLGVHRTVFSPADLPLVLRATAPAGATIGGSLQGGALAPIPVPPAVDLVLGTTGGPTSGTGDVWSTELGFAPAIPTVAPGHYVSTVTFTVIGR